MTGKRIGPTPTAYRATLIVAGLVAFVMGAFMVYEVSGADESGRVKRLALGVFLLGVSMIVRAFIDPNFCAASVVLVVLMLALAVLIGFMHTGGFITGDVLLYLIQGAVVFIGLVVGMLRRPAEATK